MTTLTRSERIWPALCVLSLLAYLFCSQPLRIFLSEVRRLLAGL